jgi:hypothetical protein
MHDWGRARIRAALLTGFVGVKAWLPMPVPSQTLAAMVRERVQANVALTRRVTAVMDRILSDCRCPANQDAPRCRLDVPPGMGPNIDKRNVREAAEAVAQVVLRVLVSAARRGAAGDDGGEADLLPRRGERFHFLYSLQTDPSRATAAVPGEWDDDRLLFVFRVRPDGAAEPWVVVGPSAAMAGKGERGRGVYAWGAGFRRGALVGVYVGKVLGLRASARVGEFLASTPQRHPFDALMVIDDHLVSGKHDPHEFNELFATFETSGRVLYPRAEVRHPGVFAHLMNDARGVAGAFCNVRVVDPDGVVEAFEDVPPFDVTKSWKANLASELLWTYGPQYWMDE